MIFGTSCLWNLYQAVPYETKLEIVRQFFEHLESPVVLDSAGKCGAGLSQEVIGKTLRQLGKWTCSYQAFQNIGFDRYHKGFYTFWSYCSLLHILLVDGVVGFISDRYGFEFDDKPGDRPGLERILVVEAGSIFHSTRYGMYYLDNVRRNTRCVQTVPRSPSGTNRRFWWWIRKGIKLGGFVILWRCFS